MFHYYIIEFSDSTSSSSVCFTEYEKAIKFVGDIMSSGKKDSRKLTKVMVINSYSETLQVVVPVINGNYELEFKEKTK